MLIFTTSFGCKIISNNIFERNRLIENPPEVKFKPEIVPTSNIYHLKFDILFQFSGFEKRKLPNERALSLAITELNGNEGKTTEDNKNSMIGPLWGQFVTHDIIQTPDMGNGQTKCDCSAIAECKNIEVDRTTDPHFDDIDCMFVIRSAPHVPSQGPFITYAFSTHAISWLV